MERLLYERRTAMDKTSVRQAFEAMTWFVKQFQDRGPFKYTGSLLHALNQVNAVNTDADEMDLKTISTMAAYST